MKNNLNIKSLTPLLKNVSKVALKHASFGAVLLVLLAYLFMVWRINSLSGREPSSQDQSTALSQAHLPKVDKKTISQIQALENSNTQIKSLFNDARNNPFQE